MGGVQVMVVSRSTQPSSHAVASRRGEGCAHVRSVTPPSVFELAWQVLLGESKMSHRKIKYQDQR